jgi:hypothetical protein
MSFEHLCFFEVPDIRAVHFRCQKCGGENVVPVNQLRGGNWLPIVTNACSHCHAPSGIQPGTVEGQAFLNFIDSLGKMAEAATGRNLAIRLEVICPEK